MGRDRCRAGGLCPLRSVHRHPGLRLCRPLALGAGGVTWGGGAGPGSCVPCAVVLLPRSHSRSRGDSEAWQVSCLSVTFTLGTVASLHRCLYALVLSHGSQVPWRWTTKPVTLDIMGPPPGLCCQVDPCESIYGSAPRFPFPPSALGPGPMLTFGPSLS